MQHPLKNEACWQRVRQMQHPLNNENKIWNIIHTLAQQLEGCWCSVRPRNVPTTSNCARPVRNLPPTEPDSLAMGVCACEDVCSPPDSGCASRHSEFVSLREMAHLLVS